MKKVLLVDDDPFILDIYSSLLKKEGYRVDITNNAKKALEKIFDSYPDLLILDLNLDIKQPGPKDGLDILKTIRQDPRAKNLKVVVVSNYYDEKKFSELSNLYCLGVIKSFLKAHHVPGEVVKKVKEILN